MAGYGIGGGPPPRYMTPEERAAITRAGVGPIGVGAGPAGIGDPSAIYAAPPPGMYEAYKRPVPAAIKAKEAAKAPLREPPVQLRPPPAQLSLEAARRGIPTGGIAAAQRRIGALELPAYEESEEARRARGEYEVGLWEAEEAEEARQQALDIAFGDLEQEQATKRLELKNLKAKEDRYRAQGLKELDEADLERRYAGSGMRAGELRKVQALARGKDLDNPDREVSDEEQQAAQAKLTKWESIDPDRAFSGGKRVLAAIGSALGAYAAAITGTPNFAGETIKAAIARDIEEQRFRFKQAGERAERLRDRFAMNMAKFGDEEKAIMATYHDYLQYTGQKLSILASKSASAERQAKLLGMRAQLSQETDKFRLAWGQQAVETGLAIERLQLSAEQMRQQVEMFEFKALSPAQLKELPDPIKDDIAASYTVIDKVNKMRKLWNAKIKGEAAIARILEPGFTFRDAWAHEAKLLGVSVMRMIERGKMSDTDRKFYLELVPEVGAWSKEADYMLNSIEDHIRARVRNNVKVYKRAGYETWEEEPTTTPGAQRIEE